MLGVVYIVTLLQVNNWFLSKRQHPLYKGKKGINKSSSRMREAYSNAGPNLDSCPSREQE